MLLTFLGGAEYNFIGSSEHSVLPLNYFWEISYEKF